MEQMLEPQPGTDDTGLGYGVGRINGDKVVSHSAANAGWNARFFLDVNRREGFVVAVNSMPGGPLVYAVQNIWLKSVMGIEGRSDPPPAEEITASANKYVLKWTLAFGGLLLAATAWCGYQISSGRRRWLRPLRKRRLFVLLPSALVSLLWWYWFYAPRVLRLPVSPALPDLWVLPLVNYITTALVGWVGVSLLFVLFPRTRKPENPPTETSQGKLEAVAPL